ncbi:MAG: hypothetical protein ACI856_000348 [Kiritimatiellia bacterium]|jgi:uncharacterized protein (DUF58 family)
MRRLEQLAITSRKLSTGRLRGERRSRRRGTSNEFSDYRNYVHGDDLRYLDWKVYARLEKLFLKLFLEEEDLRVNILLDTSASMTFGEPEKHLYAKRVAAAIGYICLCKMDSLTAHTFDAELSEPFGPKRGKVNAARYFDFLDKAQATRETRLGDSMKRFSQSQRGRGIAVVISDFMDTDGYEEGLRHLFARNYEVLAVHVLSPEELKPTIRGDVRLVDAELEVSTDVSMGRRLEDVYDRTLKTFCNGLKSYVVNHGGYYVLSSTEMPFDRLVLDVLRRRGVVQ